MKLYLSAILPLAVLCLGGQAKGGNEMGTAQEIIQALDLKPLPDEGGFFRETYRSGRNEVDAAAFGIHSNSKRSLSTAIYYMVTPESFSALHKVKSDEIFHFYGGSPVEMIQIDKQGNLTRYILGSDILNGEIPQVLVSKGTWQALRLTDGSEWALMGTTVAPGFEFEDFTLGQREQMIEEFPQHREDIIRFTREP